MKELTKPEQIIHFWFNELSSKQWWEKDPALDQLIRDRFLNEHNQAITGELFNWRKTPEGRLAEIILIDQFSRNMFRDKEQ